MTMTDILLQPGDMLLAARPGSFLCGIVTRVWFGRCDIVFMTRSGGSRCIDNLNRSCDNWSSGTWIVVSYDD